MSDCFTGGEWVKEEGGAGVSKTHPEASLKPAPPAAVQGRKDLPPSMWTEKDFWGKKIFWLTKYS